MLQKICSHRRTDFSVMAFLIIASLTPAITFSGFLVNENGAQTVQEHNPSQTEIILEATVPNGSYLPATLAT